MKKKVFVITAICLAIALCVAAIGLTFAWYTNRASVENGMILNANGVLVIYFDANEIDGKPIKPAVAVKGAITDNETHFDVLTKGGNIAEAATVSNFNSMFRYLNAKEENPDAGINVPCKVKIDCSAAMLFGETEEALSLTYDLAVEATLTCTYLSIEENGAPKTFRQENFVWGSTVSLEGNADLGLEIRVYLKQPDDLCPPGLLDSDGIKVSIFIKAENANGTENP